MFSKIIMSICALLAGCGVSAGVFAFVLVIGVIPRMIRLCKINSIILVENVMICGVIWGNLSSIMAGEFYASRERYVRQIEELHLGEEVILHDFFVPDADVKYYFSAADVLVQPYKTATQSGVTQIAYNFELPMIVTGVGGLPEIVPDGRVGYVCRPDAAGVADALVRICEGDTLARFRSAMREEKRRFSWEEMCDRITELYESIR